MEEARQALARIDEWLAGCGKPRAREKAQPNRAEAIEDDGFAEALDDDLNISAALGHLFDRSAKVIASSTAGSIPPGRACWLEWWERINRVLALEAERKSCRRKSCSWPRNGSRRGLPGDWEKSDELRDATSGARGWEARDTKDGQVVTRRGGA